MMENTLAGWAKIIEEQGQQESVKNAREAMSAEPTLQDILIQLQSQREYLDTLCDEGQIDAHQRELIGQLGHAIDELSMDCGEEK